MWPWQLGIDGWIGMLISSSIATGIAIVLSVMVALAARALSESSQLRIARDFESTEQPIALEILSQRCNQGEFTQEECLELRSELEG